MVKKESVKKPRILYSLSENCISSYSLILALSFNFFHCVVLVVAVCYLGHPKNLLID